MGAAISRSRKTGFPWVGTPHAAAQFAKPKEPARHMGGKPKSEITGKKAASVAAKVLRDPKARRAAKSAAGSALTQRPDRSK